MTREEALRRLTEKAQQARRNANLYFDPTGFRMRADAYDEAVAIVQAIESETPVSIRCVFCGERKPNHA